MAGSCAILGASGIGANRDPSGFGANSDPSGFALKSDVVSVFAANSDPSGLAGLGAVNRETSGFVASSGWGANKLSALGAKREASC